MNRLMTALAKLLFSLPTPSKVDDIQAAIELIQAAYELLKQAVASRKEAVQRIDVQVASLIDLKGQLADEMFKADVMAANLKQYGEGAGNDA